MGLFDKIKSIKNAVTGGAAKVYVEASAASLSAPIQVTIRAVPQGCDVKYDRVYVKLRGVELVEISNYQFDYYDDGQRKTSRETVRKRTTTVEVEVNAAGAGELKEGETGEWTVQIELPSHAMPVYRGHYVRHEYELLAALDTFGNDPDSGWVDLHIS